MADAGTESSVGSVEQRCLALVAVLMLAPAAVCGLWVVVAHLAGLRGEVPAPNIIAAGSIVALCGLLPFAINGLRGKQARVALVGVTIVAAFAPLLVASKPVWLLLPILLAVGAGSGWVFRRIVPRLPQSFDGHARRHKVLTLLWLLSALAAVTQSHRMGIFMTDPNEFGYSLMPGLEIIERHSCLSAYVHGASLAQSGFENVYDFGSAPTSMTVVDLSPFERDAYGYPPPFLLLPRAFLALTDDFTLLRALWYVVNMLAMAAVWTIAAYWLGGRGRHQMFKLLPLFWLSMPVQFTLQTGNFHIAAVFLAVLAMIAIDRRHPGVGGFLLAFTTLSKFAPGLLALLLLVRRNLRAAVWTAAFGVLLSLAVLPVFGMTPWKAFFDYHLPRLQSGEALGFLDRGLNEIANNFSPFGIPFKFQQLGFDVGWELARTFGTLYSVFLIVLAVLAALRLRSGDRSDQLRVWLALLTLGALRSPFAPPHVLVPAIWLLVLLAGEIRSKWQVTGFVMLWILFNVFAPMEAVLPAILLSLFRQALLLGGVTWLALRKP